ncbi:hypothetical protein [Methylobacterium nodulans]|uniref:hypothetical protein n=1 Tax=Methylobacterium nodulans TaxID=114616 RepID=UPI000681E487|nr:hypothetical protein [Methylobacterium nodulans]
MAVLLSQYTDWNAGIPFTQVEVATLDDPTSVEFARSFLAAVQAVGATSTLYRGKAISEMGSSYSGRRAAMRAHKLPAVAPDALILDEATMDRLDRGSFLRDRLRALLRARRL